MKLNTRIFISLISTSLLSATVLAAPLKDWKNIEDIDAVLQTPVCRAFNSTAKSTLPVEMSIAVPKDPSLMPVVYVKITGVAAKAPYALIRFAKKEFQPLFLLQAGATAADPDIYWYAPKDLSRLLKLVDGSEPIDFVFSAKDPTPIPVRFTTNGSSAALEQLQNCAKTKSLLPLEFLKALNQEIPLNSSLPANVTAQDLQTLTQKAYKEYADGRTSANALAQLRKTMKPLADKEAVAQKDLSAKQNALDATLKTLNQKQSELSTLEAQLAQFNADLANLQADKATADQDLIAKKAIYDPLKAQLKPLEQDVDTRAKILRSANVAVEDAQDRVSNDQSRIEQLRNRDSELRNEISSLQSQLSSANSDLQRASSNLNSFNPQWQRRQILDSSWQYRNAIQEAQSYNQQANQLRNDLQNAESNLRNAEFALNSCRNQSQPHCLANLKFDWDPGQGGGHGGHHGGSGDGNGPGNGDPNQPPPPEPPMPLPEPTPPPCVPPPPPNCSAQESTWSSAVQQRNDIRSRFQQAESAEQNAQWRVRQIEQDADQQVAQMQNQLQNEYNQAANRVNSISRDLSSDQNELSNNENSAIPSLQNDLSSARSALPGLLTQQAQAKSDLDTAKQRLETLRQQIGFDVAEKNYQDAIAKQKQLASSIGEKAAAIGNTNKSLAKIRPVVAQLTQAASKQTADRDASQAKLSVVQTQLAPARQQEQSLVAQVDQAKTTLSVDRALYQTEYLELSKGI